MDYYSMVVILGIMFWVLLALGVVCLMIWIFVHFQYYTWDKEDRIKSGVIKDVQETIRQTLSEIEAEQYASDFEEGLEEPDSGGN